MPLRRSRSLRSVKPHPFVHRSAQAPTAVFWAIATLGSFPVAMMLASAFGASIPAAFFLGLSASLLAILANVALEGRLWMFETRWRRIFEQPEFSFRLVLLSGVLLLIIETGLLIFFFTSASLDHALIGLVYNRQCQNPTVEFQTFCETVKTEFAPAACQ